MAEHLIPHNEVEEGAIIVATTPNSVENNHTSAPKANANFVTPVTNGTTETKKQNFPKKVTGPKEVKSGEKLEYIISEYEVNNEDTLDKDKQRMRWCFYIEGVKLSGSKKHVQIKNSENQKEDVVDNFLIIDNAAKRTLAIENDAYLYAKAEVVEEDGEKKNKLTIVFSKWLDGKKVHVEAFRNRPEHKPKKGYVVTASVTAKPEVININWVNAKEEPIKFTGYDQDVFLQVETIGMKDKELNLDILDYDKGGEDDKLDWGANSIKITGRKTLKQFPIKKKAEYGLQQKDEKKPGLDLYVVVNSSESLENCKDKYATYLDLNPDEKVITAYFAEERKKEIQKGEETSKSEEEIKPEEKPKEGAHTVKKGDTMYDVAKKYGVSHHKVLREYNNLTSNSLKVGQVLKIPPKEEKEKPKGKEEKKDTKTITYYQKIDSATLGSEVYLTAEAQNLEGKTVTFKVFEKEPVLLTEKDTPLPLLVDKEEKTEVEAKVSDGKAQIAVILKRKDKEAHQQWKDILSPPEECIDGVWYDSKKDQDVKMKDDDQRIIDEPDRYTPAIKHQEKKKTYLWLQVTCEGDQLDFDQPFLKKSGAFEVFYDASYNPWPVKKTYNGHKRRLGSGYGPRNVKNRPEASKFHRGLDINFGGGYDDFGAPVISTHDGIIVEAKDNTRGSGGRTVTVEAEDGSFQTRYNHLSEITVSLNQNVSKGQTIGKIGASAWGKEKGSDSHLHYAIKKKDSNGKLQWYNPTEGKENKEENMVDPQSWIK